MPGGEFQLNEVWIERFIMHCSPLVSKAHEKFNYLLLNNNLHSEVSIGGTESFFDKQRIKFFKKFLKAKFISSMNYS